MLLAATLALAAAPGPAASAEAEEFAWFRLTGYDGYLQTSYLTDRYETEQSGVAAAGRTRQTQRDLRAEIMLMTHGFVYHPNFMEFDFGTGPVFQRADYTTELVGMRTSKTLYNLIARARFLREKPYRGSVFYEHVNPTVMISSAEALNQESDRYGFDFSLLSPVTSVPLRLDATRSHTRGRSALRTVDDRIDQFNLVAERYFGPAGYSQFQYQGTRQDSSSGSPNLQIQRSQQDMDYFILDSRWKLGPEREHELNNLITYNEQSYTLERGAVPALKDWRFLLFARGRHSERLLTSASYNYFASDRGETRTRLNSADLGVTATPWRNVTFTGGLRTDNSRATDVSFTSYATDASAQFSHATRWGTGAASYATRYEQRDQRAAQTQASVIGERIALPGTFEVALSRPRIDVATVVVSNAQRTQSFVLNIDYALTVVGEETRIRRLIGGNILDGEQVLIDYSYDSGGTYANTQTDDTVNLSWSVPRIGSVYLRWFNAQPRLTSGAPTAPLNTVRSRLAGVRIDIPVDSGFVRAVGGFLEHEDRRETISSYVRDSHEVYMQTDMPFVSYGSLRVAVRRAKTDRDGPIGDLDLKGIDVSLWTRLAWGLDVSATGTRETELADLIERDRTTGRLRATWRLRQLSVTFDLAYTRETQGASVRTRNYGNLVLRREF